MHSMAWYCYVCMYVCICFFFLPSRFLLANLVYQHETHSFLYAPPSPPPLLPNLLDRSGLSSVPPALAETPDRSPPSEQP